MFTLHLNEWKQIKYIIDLTRLFNFFITNISTSLGLTVYYTLRVYHTLLLKLYKTRTKLRYKSYPWASKMIRVTKAIEKKINKYY